MIQRRCIVPRQWLPPGYEPVGATIYTGAAPGEASNATVVTQSEETKYLADIYATAHALDAQIPSVYNISEYVFLYHVKQKDDPFWNDPDNQDRYATVTEWRQWLAEFDAHKKSWDSRSVLDDAGRFLVGGLVGVFLVNDWARKTAQYDQDLHDWAKRLVDEKIVPADKVPNDQIQRPSSFLDDSAVGGGTLGGGKFGAADTITNAVLKPLLYAGLLVGGVVLAVNVIPPLLQARAAAKAAA